jgi:uncharacterized membrane protein
MSLGIVVLIAFCAYWLITGQWFVALCVVAAGVVGWFIGYQSGWNARR